MNPRAFSVGLTLLAAAGLILAGCGSDDGTAGTSSGGDGPSVLAAFYPLAFVAERVGGEQASVANLTQPGVESHDLELTGRQVGSIADADLVVYLKGFQPAVDEAVEQNGSGELLDAGGVAELIPDEHGHDHGDESAEEEHGAEDEGHDHEHAEDEHGEGEHAEGEHAEDEHAEDDGHDHGDLEGDPHFWLDPANMVALTHAVEEKLTELAPENAETYAANAEKLTGELEQLDEEFHTGLAQCERSLIVVSHEAFGYLAAHYGLEQLGVAGLDPESDPSPARVAEVQQTIQAEGVTTIFHERLTSPDAVQSLADDLGLEVAVLDPVEGLTDETDDQDYLSLMRENLEALRTANGCD